MATYKKEIELTRVNVNLPTNLVEKVKKYAVEMGLTTTSAYITLLNNGLDQKNTIDFLSQLISKVQNEENLDDINDK